MNPDDYFDIFLRFVPAGSLIIDGHVGYLNI